MHFYLNFFVVQRNNLIRKIRLNSKFMTSQNGKQTIAICILPNILRSKDNQVMKFVQLVEYNLRNIFLEKSYKKCGGKTISRLFSKKNWAYRWINSRNFYTVCFYCIPNWGLWKHIESKLQITCFHLIQIFFIFLKKKVVWNYLPASFSVCFLNKTCFCYYILLTGHISLSGCLHFVRYWAICLL